VPPRDFFRFFIVFSSDARQDASKLHEITGEHNADGAVIRRCFADPAMTAEFANEFPQRKKACLTGKLS
jgi:hypothetical protein